MTKYKISSFILSFLFVLPFGLTQNSISRTIRVKASVIEQLKGSVRRVPDKKLSLIGLGECTTDELGEFEFVAPLHDFNRYDPQLNVEIKILNFEIISPYEGILQLDTAGYQVELEIVVVGRDLEEEYRKKLNQLSRKLKRSQKANDLSLRRINAINDSLLHSMAINEQEKAELENVIAGLKEKSEKLAAEKESLSDEKESLTAEKESLNNQLENLNSELEGATKQLQELAASLEERDNELYIALEERYLRQQNYYKSISADLKDFLTHTKDIHDLMQSLDKYFRRGKYPNYASTYNQTLEAYNGIFEKINNNYLDYVQGVQRYWNSPLIAQQVQDTFEIIFDQLHHPRLKPSIQEINGFIRQNKKSKATKVAHSTFHDLNPLILNLEKSVDRTLSILEEKM